MNFKKITSLLLAVLMVASALPLALFSAFADDANGSASAPVAGTAPDKLPNGEAYSTTNMFVDPKATIQKSTYEGANWISDTGRQVASVSHLNNAEGIMFKVDSSAIEEGTDALAFKLLFEIIVGETKDTWAHLSMNAGGTSWYGRNTPLEGTTSTWYYSADGATWAELTSAASNMPVTANREEAYVYVPFSEMWYDASLAEIKGDVVKYDKNDSASTGPSASYDEVKAAGYQNLTTGAKSEGTCRIRVNFDNNSMADAVLSDWTFVYKYEKPAETSSTAPTTLPNGETYKSTALYKSAFDLVGTIESKVNAAGGSYSGQTHWTAPATADAALAAVKDGAAGIMFKVDTTKATCISNDFTLTFALQIFFGQNYEYNTYLLSTARFAPNFSEGKFFDGASSTWYYAQDGKTWNEISNITSEHATVPAGKGYTYVFVPMDAFWTKCGETFLKTGKHAEYTEDGKVKATEPIVNWTDAVAMIGDNWKFGGSNFYYQGNAASPTLSCDFNTDVTDWMVVGNFTADTPSTPDTPVTPPVSGDVPAIPTDPSTTSPTAPTVLPNGETYKKATGFVDSFDLMATYRAYCAAQDEKVASGAQEKPDYSQSQWQSNKIYATDATQTVKNGAAGFMFKIDTTNATSEDQIFDFTFALQVNFRGFNTYILSTAKQATAFGEALLAEGASSTWYYSYNGKSWTALDATTNRAPVPAGKGYTYVFVPMDAFWTKCGETFLKTGKHAEYTEDGKVKATEPIVNWNDAVKLMGDDWTFGMANFYFAGKADKSSLEQDPATKISAWRLVTEGEPTAVGGSETPPPTLPDDETYVGTTVIAASFDMMATYRAYGDKKGDYSQTGWPGNVDAKMTEWIKDGAKGVMFKIDTTKATADDETFSMTFAIQVAFNGTSTYFVSTPKHATAFSEALMKDGASSTWYYSQNGTSWTSLEITASTGSYANIPAGKSYTYVYVPLDAFWTKCGETFLKTGDHAERTDDGKPKATEPIVNFSDAIAMMGDGWELKAFNFYFSGNSSKATLEQDVNTYLMDIKVVKYGVPGEIPEGGAEHAPEMLPNGEQYKAVPLDPDFSIKGNVYEGKAPDSNNTASSAWQSFWFASDKRLSDSEKIDFKTTGGEIQNAKGIMFKFDTSKAALANPTDILKMSVELSVNVPGGKSTYFLADPYYITSYGGKVVGTPSTVWYYSVDGFTWESVEKGKGGNGVGVTNACTVGYIYIPLDQFWTKGYKIDDVSKRATEALAEMGGEAKITDMKVRLGNDSVSSHANTVISDFMVIKSAYCMSRETVTIADTLEWNVYVAAPSTYSNAAMTFKMGDKTVDAKPQVLKDGSLKYTLTGISIADIATSVTAKWTATDDKGAPYSETYTTTMEKYMRAVLDNPANTDYVATVRALLHYAAALQTANGYKGDLANKDVPAVEASSVDLDRLQYTTYENNFTDMWGTPKLSVKDGVTTVKIPVTAPSKDYNKVRYETEYGRVGTVDIKNGYAYIPVYAHEMRLTFKLDFYKNGSMSNAGSMRFSLNYLLAQEYAANKADPAVVQAFANFCNEARKLKY